MAQVFGPIAGVDLTATPAGTGTSSDEGAPFTLGTVVGGPDNQEYVFVHASAAISQYDFVTIDENFEATPMTETSVVDGHTIGVCQVALADNDFGWAAIKGSNLQGNVGESCAADTTLYVNANGEAGTLFTLTSGTAMIDGVVAVAAQGGTSVATNVEVLISSYMHAGNVI